MACSKLVLLSIGLYGLAFLFAFSEARPADGDSKIKLSGKVIKDALNGVPNEKLGDIANGLPGSLAANLLNLPDAALAATVVRDVPKADIINALNALPDKEKEDLLKNADLPASIKNLPKSQRAAAIANLPDAKLGQLAVALPKEAKLDLARKFSKGTIGAVVKDLPPKAYEVGLSQIPPDQLKKIISELFNREPPSGSTDLAKIKKALEDRIIEIISTLPHAYIGQIATELNPDEVGYLTKKISSAELADLLKELTTDELKAGLQKVPFSDIQKEIKKLPADTKKAYFGDKADTIDNLPSDQVIDILAKLSSSKQAHLIKNAKDVDAGDNVQALSQEKIGRLIHELPSKELRDIIDAIIVDALAGKDNGKIKGLTSDQIEDIANKISNAELGKLANAFPESVEGKVFKTLSIQRFTQFLRELRKGDKRAALKNVAPGHIKNSLIALPEDYLKATFGDKAKDIPNYTDSQIIDLILTLPTKKQAGLIKKEDDVDAGAGLHGLPTKKVGKFIHELTPDEIKNIIYQSFIDIFGEANPRLTPEKVTAIIQNLPDERIGNIAHAIAPALLGKIVRTASQDQIALLLTQLSRDDKLAAFHYIPFDDIRKVIDGLTEDEKKDIFGDKDPSKLSDDELKNLLVDLSNSKVANIFYRLTDEDAGRAIQGLPEPIVGELLKDAPTDQLTQLIYNDKGLLEKELTPDVVDAAINNLNDLQVGDIAEAVPTNLVGNVAKRIPATDTAKFLEEIPTADRVAAQKNVPRDNLRKYILALPEDTKKDDFGDKASTLSQLTDSELFEVVAEVANDKLAKLFQNLDDADAGFEVKGLKPAEIGHFIHETPEDDKKAIIKAVLRDIFEGNQ